MFTLLRFTLFRNSGTKISGCFSVSRCSHTNISSSSSNNATQQHRQPAFGIVAAVTRNGIIGINGKLPWKHDFIPQDWNHFLNLTRNKILILGRKTFGEEDPTRAHVNHARVCIVVSNTMNESDLLHCSDDSSEGPELIVKLARSFDEALDLASEELLQSAVDDVHDDDDASIEDSRMSQTIDCWVAGGEYIYREALSHKNAEEVQLTHVDMDVNLDQYETTSSARSSIAYFPLEDMKRQGFKKVSGVSSGICEFIVYKRDR